MKPKRPRKKAAPKQSAPPVRRLKSPAAPLPPKPPRSDNRERPVIPALKYSTRNKTEAAYKERAKVLRDKYGANLGVKLNRKLTPQAKSAITRATKKLGHYLKAKHDFVFKKLTPAQVRKVKRSGSVEKEAVTSRGVFVKAPKPAVRELLADEKRRAQGKRGKGPGGAGAAPRKGPGKGPKGPGPVKVTVDRKGNVSVKQGAFESTRRIISRAELAKRPELILEMAKQLGAKFMTVNIRGFQGSNIRTVGAFYYYLKNDLLPELGEDDEENEPDDEESEGVFSESIGVEFLTY